TVAIDGAGLLLALAAAAHDTLYTDADRRILDAFARQARPIVVGQAVVLLALASLVALWAVAGGHDALLPQSMTRAAVPPLLPAAVLFAVTAALLWQRASTRGSAALRPPSGGARRGPRGRAVAWLVLAVLLAGAWSQRQRAFDAVLVSHSPAAG